MAYGCSYPNGHVIKRALLYKCPPTINHKIKDGKTALALASYYGQAKAVGYILQRHPIIDQAGPDGLTAFGHALAGLTRSTRPTDYTPHYAETILRLLKAGADPRCPLPSDLLQTVGIGNAINVVIYATRPDRLSMVDGRRLVEKLVQKGVTLDVCARDWLLSTRG